MSVETNARDDAVLNAIVANKAGLGAVARRHKMTLAELAAWAAAPEQARALEETRALADARVPIALAQARAAAAEELLRLAREAKSEETQRKASLDLLRLEAKASGVPGASAPTLQEGAEAIEITQEQADRFLAAYGASDAAREDAALAVRA